MMNRRLPTLRVAKPCPIGWSSLEGEGRVAFRYDGVNPNGSQRNIAGIINENGNVLGMMPHPERVVEPAHGSIDGRRLFEGLLEAVA